MSKRKRATFSSSVSLAAPAYVSLENSLQVPEDSFEGVFVHCVQYNALSVSWLADHDGTITIERSFAGDEAAAGASTVIAVTAGVSGFQKVPTGHPYIRVTWEKTVDVDPLEELFIYTTLTKAGVPLVDGITLTDMNPGAEGESVIAPGGSSPPAYKLRKIAALTDDVQISADADQVLINAGHTLAAPSTAIIFGGEDDYTGKNVGGMGNSVVLGGTDAWDGGGANSVYVGYKAGRISSHSYVVAVGAEAGACDTGQNSESIALGYRAAGGAGAQGAAAISIGANAGYSRQGQGAIAIGAGAADADQPNYSIALGFECETPSVAGRVAFGGDTLETLDAITADSIEPLAGLFKIDHRGTEYKIPLLSSTATDLDTGGAGGSLASLTADVTVSAIIGGHEIPALGTKVNDQIPGAFDNIFITGEADYTGKVSDLTYGCVVIGPTNVNWYTDPPIEGNYESVVIGTNALADIANYEGDNAISELTAIGHGVMQNWKGYTYQNTIIGSKAGSFDVVDPDRYGQHVTVVGQDAGHSFAIAPDDPGLGDDSTGIGYGCCPYGDQSTAVGAQSFAGGDTYSSAFGALSSAGAFGATALGAQASASGEDSIAIGRACTVSVPNRVGFGSVEAVVPYDTASEEPMGFLPIQWNDDLFRVPILSETATKFRAPQNNYMFCTVDGPVSTDYVNATYKQLTIAGTSTVASGFSVQNSNLEARCDVAYSAVYRVSYSVYNNGSQPMRYELRKNNVVITGSAIYTESKVSVSSFAIVTLTNTDYITLWALPYSTHTTDRYYTTIGISPIG